jgi:signal transduction histidine kinase/ActR/RegA family two-component response regulator
MQEADQGRRRWRMVFRQSPLPQMCYEAAALFELVRPEFEAGERRLGDLLKARVGGTAEALRHFNMIESNQATSLLLGLADQEAPIGPGHFDETLFARLCESLNHIDQHGVLPAFESRLIRDDGVAVDVQIHVRMPLDQDPPWSLCVATCVDLTQSKRAARAEREAREAAEAANRAKSEFLAVMSHEIRTPLNGVLGMAQALERDELSPTQLERARIILRSGAALRDLLDNILDLSKIEAGRLELEIADVDVAAMAAEVRSLFLPAARRKGLGFELDVSPAAQGCFRADAGRLRQVLCNLVSNAVKFTEAGQVGLRLDATARGLTLAVSDTGPGVSPKKLPQLFEKFVQADSSTTRRFGGTGLGLAVCKALCAGMGGEILAESKVGRGSTFTVRLPAPRSLAAAPHEAPVQPDRESVRAGDVRILAAEDNPVNQVVLKTLLGQLGLEPVIVSDGAQAVSAWRQDEWDLILMDIQMPAMDGPSAARAIRQEEAATGRVRTPIIALTANAMAHQIDSYQAVGMDAVVAKPIEVGALFQAINAALSATDAADAA